MNPFVVSEEQTALSQLEALRKRSCRTCADCHDVIAPNVDLTHGVFLCNTCATFHRSAEGCRVKTLSYTKWRLPQVAEFEAKQGPQINRRIEEEMLKTFKAVPSADRLPELELYLAAKYKLWKSSSEAPLAAESSSLPLPPPATVKPKPQKRKPEKKDDFFSATQDIFGAPETEPPGNRTLLFNDSLSSVFTAPSKVQDSLPVFTAPSTIQDSLPVFTAPRDSLPQGTDFSWDQQEPTPSVQETAIEDFWSLGNQAKVETIGQSQPKQEVDLLDLSLEEDRKTEKRFQVEE